MFARGLVVAVPASLVCSNFGDLCVVHTDKGQLVRAGENSGSNMMSCISLEDKGSAPRIESRRREDWGASGVVNSAEDVLVLAEVSKIATSCVDGSLSDSVEYTEEGELARADCTSELECGSNCARCSSSWGVLKFLALCF